jgi:hypothetical protein
MRNMFKLIFHGMPAGKIARGPVILSARTKSMATRQSQSIRLALSNFKQRSPNLLTAGMGAADKNFSRRPRPMLVPSRTSSDRSPWPLREGQA